MKEVTICFSFSVRDGVLEASLSALNTLPGSYIVGIRSIEKQKLESKIALSLLEKLSINSPGVYIASVALGGRKLAIPLDDLEAKNTTYAKGDKP